MMNTQLYKLGTTPPYLQNSGKKALKPLAGLIAVTRLLQAKAVKWLIATYQITWK